MPKPTSPNTNINLLSIKMMQWIGLVVFSMCIILAGADKSMYSDPGAPSTSVDHAMTCADLEEGNEHCAGRKPAPSECHEAKQFEDLEMMIKCALYAGGKQKVMGMWNVGVLYAKSNKLNEAFAWMDKAVTLATNVLGKAPINFLIQAADMAYRTRKTDECVRLLNIGIPVGLEITESAWKTLLRASASGDPEMLMDDVGDYFLGKQAEMIASTVALLGKAYTELVDSNDIANDGVENGEYARALGAITAWKASSEAATGKVTMPHAALGDLYLHFGQFNLSIEHRMLHAQDSVLKATLSRGYSHDLVVDVVESAVGGAAYLIALSTLRDALLRLLKQSIQMADKESLEWIGLSCGVEGFGDKYTSGHTAQASDFIKFIATCFEQQDVIANSDADASWFNPQKTGWSVLHYAARSGSADVMRAVIGAIAEEHPAMVAPYVFYNEKKAVTPLHVAVADDFVDVAKVLVDYGIDPHLHNEAAGYSAIEIACLKRWSDADMITAFGGDAKGICPNGVVAELKSVPLTQQLGSGGYLKPKPGSEPDDHVPASHACDIDVRDNTLSREEFETEYLALKRPVVLRGLQRGSDWDELREKWARDQISTTHPTLAFLTGSIPYARTFGVGGSDVTGVDDYLSYMRKISEGEDEVESNNEDEEESGGRERAVAGSRVPNYSFTNLNKAPNDFDGQFDLHEEMKNATVVPELFEHTTMRGSFQFFLGPAGTGAPIHMHASAFNVLMYGRKRWYLLPPPHAMYSKQPIMEWLADGNVERLSEIDGALYSCVQEAGDIIFVPEAWGHGILNLQETVGFAIEFDWQSSMTAGQIEIEGIECTGTSETDSCFIATPEDGPANDEYGLANDEDAAENQV
eukprot:m.139786 g.139786  ORF g.139786 m.139786 type:complete len:864 (+) comp30080_c0_seq2:305-2896(+)